MGHSGHRKPVFSWVRANAPAPGFATSDGCAEQSNSGVHGKSDGLKPKGRA
jgi:hypothetical protein